MRLPTYVLSLTHATTRRANMVERLEEVEADFTLVEAINASQQIAGGQVGGSRGVTGFWGGRERWRSDGGKRGVCVFLLM